MSAEKPTADLRVQNEGSIFLLHAQTDAGRAWVDEHVVREQTFGDAIVVEHRYIAALVQGAQRDGLTVE